MLLKTISALLPVLFAIVSAKDVGGGELKFFGVPRQNQNDLYKCYGNDNSDRNYIEVANQKNYPVQLFHQAGCTSNPPPEWVAAKEAKRLEGVYLSWRFVRDS
ncbi:hypothetical protein [Parasitella parasitica]|uniref:Uncharacterized protein n=1 Tax=Parasitella parasitica TaxID=35722 RepID=A0A0B7MMT9_9FUNG|nr:hypothetical protein [Parasitella parasitica]